MAEDDDFKDFDPDLRRAFEFADQTVDKSIKRASAFKMGRDTIKLSGDACFYTLQGEGPTMGLPCVFTRLHVCNLKCTWCDAWYTWNPNTREFWTEPRDVSFEECADLISSTWAGSGLSFGKPGVQKRVIFTGGEPLIQRKQLEELVRGYLDPIAESGRDSGWTKAEWAVEVETNGTLMPTDYQLDNWQFNCSPKLDNSDNRDFSRIKPKILDALNQANSTFKFVCKDESDLDEIEKYFEPLVDFNKIIIMPEGITSDEIDAHMRELAEPVKKRGLRMLGRMQAQAWDGARRGV